MKQQANVEQSGYHCVSGAARRDRLYLPVESVTRAEALDPRDVSDTLRHVQHHRGDRGIVHTVLRARNRS